MKFYKMKTRIPLIFSLLLATWASAQNIGIGTSVPAKRLHIKGVNEILRIQGSTPWIGFLNDTDGDYRGYLYYPDTSLVFGSASGTNMPLIIAPNNAGLLYATGDQRVGIGKASPTEKLDINGNINIEGNVKIKGTSGQPGQMLTTDNAGNTVWSNMCEYRHMATYYYSPSAQTFTVPAGVTRLSVELWGGGGNSNANNAYAGSGGGYIRANLDVTPGSTITINVGNNAFDFSSRPLASSIVTYNGIRLEAQGGSTPEGDYNPGGSFFVTPSTFRDFIGFQGEHGTPLEYSFYQISPTQFARVIKGGSGGHAGNTENTGGKNGSYTINITTGTQIYAASPHEGRTPGGGGGACPFGYCSLGTTVAGGKGLVILHF